MYTFKCKNLPKQTLEFIISVPKEDIEAEYKKAFSDLQKELEVQGFRKGKAPKDVAEKHLKKDDIYDRLIRNYMPAVYAEIVEKEQVPEFKPVSHEV
ncbi:MAG TPA: trigger factor family protein, partial [Candidatus Woesebacteria bacterium]|nr:trigger factor family protein [Candidatus Woesebacteria bacterium]